MASNQKTIYVYDDFSSETPYFLLCVVPANTQAGLLTLRVH